MKTLDFNQMEVIEGGENGCGASLVGLGLSMAGAFVSFATLNPVGLVLSVGGIYSGVAGAASSC